MKMLTREELEEAIKKEVYSLRDQGEDQRTIF